MYPYLYTNEDLYFHSKNRFDEFKKLDNHLTELYQYLKFISAKRFLLNILVNIRSEYELVVNYAYILKIDYSNSDFQERALYLFICIQIDSFLIRLRTYLTFLNAYKIAI